MPVNGSDQNHIAIDDRGLSYGDGVFETIRLHQYSPVLLPQHLARLHLGLERLGIALDHDVLNQEIDALGAQFPDTGVLKIIVTRGTGGRGYQPANNADTTRILSLHPLPDYGDAPDCGVDVQVCNQRLALQPALAGIKHLNRLEQVLAAQELREATAMEGIMMDMDSNVVEGTRSNIFWAEQDSLYTPDLSQCGVEGIMRNYLIGNLAQAKVCESSPVERLCNADEIFLCNSVFGVWPVKRILASDNSVLASKDISNEGNTFTTRAKALFRQLLTSQSRNT